MPNYCDVDELLVGDMPLPRGLRPQQYVDSATSEIDMMIGFIYQTPIDISDTSPVIRPARLLLKETARKLATGRLILAMSTVAQRTELHAYGARLVDEALAVLRQIAAGEIILTGALPMDTGPEPEANFTGPQIANVDPESHVEAYYDRVANPYYNYFGGYPVLRNDRGGLIA